MVDIPKTMRSRIRRAEKKAELDVAHDPEARKQLKALGLEVGKRVRYFSEGERWGTVKELHVKSVVIQAVAGKHLPGGDDVVLREDEVPFAGVREVLDGGRLADREAARERAAREKAALAEAQGKPVPSNKKSLPPAPPREKGYDSCDIGGCSSTPVKVFLVRKIDTESGRGQARLVAVCRDHNEKYVEAAEPNKGGIMQTPAYIPTLWNMGVVYDEFAIPQTPEVVPEKLLSDSSNEFETCYCGKPFGHRGFHRKIEGEDVDA